MAKRNIAKDTARRDKNGLVQTTLCFAASARALAASAGPRPASASWGSSPFFSPPASSSSSASQKSSQESPPAPPVPPALPSEGSGSDTDVDTPPEPGLGARNVGAGLSDYEHIDLTLGGGTGPVDASGGWNASYVRMPCHEKNTVQERPGGPNFSRWEVVKSVLACPLQSFPDVKDAILAYNPTMRSSWDISGLGDYLRNHPWRDSLFSTTIPAIANLALRLPTLLPNPIPLLRAKENKAITLNQLQIACILANAFFCTFPRRNDTRKTAEYASYPSINFSTLFAGTKEGRCDPLKRAKLDCIFHYFTEVARRGQWANPGNVTFHRQRCSSFPTFASSTATFGPVAVCATGTIEDDAPGHLEVDFANRVIGGGVLGRGTVQEEIRFLISPELLASRLFTQRLEDSDAVIMIGAERFSNYNGYAKTFEWGGPHVDHTAQDARGRFNTRIVAIDARPYGPRTAGTQYTPQEMERELRKAYVGFAPSPCVESANGAEDRSPIATGNWGCGAFGGDAQLKALLQFMAAACHRRAITYFAFGNADFADELADIHAELMAKGVTVGELYACLVSIADRAWRDETVFGYVRRSLPRLRPPAIGLPPVSGETAKPQASIA
ncbi:hypothetical protein HDU87_003794 [Geranomyces variabilis]|uniref:poly(ADP-ribose) glycohydrolase n=1 Tax=Geranomyces variabilis TaxID=109894 RepID=A0AAD5TK47_9FUNG|nr:hypothetical protein HDU87_003794 [Geranomyces variabilis]